MDGFEAFQANFFRNTRPATLIYWIFFAVIVGTCVSVFISESTFRNKNRDCLLSSYSDWVGCEVQDCNAIGFRSRTVLQESTGDGLLCSQQDLVQTASCKTVLPQCIAMNCQYSNWTPWSTCPDSCIRTPNDCSTVPNQVRTRAVIRTPLPGGDPCDWTTLVQTQQCPPPAFCSLSRQCEPNAPPADNSQCFPCPDIACTVSGNPISTMCTTTNALGADTECEPGQLLYSRTCIYADCTTQCQNNNYSYFSRCSKPCGPGDFMSTTGLECPNVSVSSCNLGNCSTGGMVRAPVATGASSIVNTFYQVCPAADSAQNFLSSTRCLAKCASNQSCSYAWQSVANGNVTLSSDLPNNLSQLEFLQILSLQRFWQYSPTAPCVTPNWDMVGATCLYICEDPQNTQFSLYTRNLGGPYDEVRGLVFPFEDGSMSCPLTPDQLTNTCATDENNLLGSTLNLVEMGGNGIIPGMMANYSFSTKTSVFGGYRFQCPISKDCIYESWTDAPAWGRCSEAPQGNDTGTRTRVRTIVSQPQFLGSPCDVEEMQEFSQCNRSLTLNSSSDIWCPTMSNGLNVNRSVSEFACHQICFDMRKEYGDDACNSFFLFNELPVGQRDPEVFLAQYPNTITAQSVTNALAVNLFPQGYSVASLNQLQGAWSSGMQTCVEGWFLGAPQTALQARAIQQLGCPGNETIQSSLTIFQPSINSNRVYVWGNKKALQDLSLTTFAILPFFSATSSPSVFDPRYTFKTQLFQSDLSCAFFQDRSDILVEECTSLSANPGVSNSILFDVPYSFAQSCSVTDWVTIHDCTENCELVFAQTRTVVNTKSSQGGLPCSRIPTYQSSLCSNFSCLETFGDVCILSPLPTLASFNTSCSSPDFAADVYLEHFSQSYIYDWSIFLSSTLRIDAPINATETILSQFFSSTVRKNAFGGHLRTEVIDAVNAQCGYQALCLSLSIGYYSLSAASSPFGWIALPEGRTCTTVSEVQNCLETRLALAHNQGKNVWDFNIGEWKCPNTCRPGGLSFSCAMGISPLSSCSCTPPSEVNPPQQTETILYQQLIQNGTILYQCNIKPPQNFVFGCSSSSACPERQCAIGNDGSPCNASSNKGICDVTNGSCTCVSPPPIMSALNCNSSCAVGFNGLQCSGEGQCNYGELEFSCTCNPGRSGDACQFAGTGLVGLLETLLYTGSALVQDISQNNSVFTYTFQNQEPRCETSAQYCAGSQLFTPQNADTFIFHPFFPPQNDPGILPMDYANICVNSLDASFNSSWIGASYLSMPLMSLTNGNSESINCETYLDSSVLPARPAFTAKARFTSHSSIPPQLRNKLFFTRCPNSNAFGAGTDNYRLSPITQFVNGASLFDLVDVQSSLADFCKR